jgi:ribosomal protein S19E (S16A)
MVQDESWERAILKAYHAAARHCADNNWIYRRVGDFIELSAYHKRATAYGGRPAYEHIVRSTIHNLREAGYLQRVGRGRYCLTDAGKTRAVILNPE